MFKTVVNSSGGEDISVHIIESSTSVDDDQFADFNGSIQIDSLQEKIKRLENKNKVSSFDEVGETEKTETFKEKLRRLEQKGWQQQQQPRCKEHLGKVKLPSAHDIKNNAKPAVQTSLISSCNNNTEQKQVVEISEASKQVINQTETLEVNEPVVDQTEMLEVKNEQIINETDKSETSEQIGKQAEKMETTAKVVIQTENNVVDNEINGNEINNEEVNLVENREESGCIEASNNVPANVECLEKESSEDRISRLSKKYLPAEDESIESKDSTPHNGNDRHTAYGPPQQTEAPRISQPPVQASPPKVQSSVLQPPPALPIVTNVPPSTPAPPTPPIGGGPPPPPPPPPIGGSAPPAPPPPPTLGSSGGGSGGSSSSAGDGGLASALASVQLRKRSESIEDRRPPPAAASPMGNMMDALNKKLLARKKMVESPDGAVENEKPAHVVNKTPAPPPMIKAPTSTLVTKTPVPAFNKNVGAKKTTNDTIRGNSTANAGASLSADELKSLKGEIMSCVKEEIQAAKNEILQVLRQELSKLSSS